MSRPIPDIRRDMHSLADVLTMKGEPEAARKLHELAEATRRRPALKRAKPTRKSLTSELAKNIRAYALQNSHLSNRVIGERFGVDGGRVSEAMHKAKGF